MNQITKSIMGLKCREKAYLYFSYIANITIICILIMIATGIRNITNESLSANDFQQMQSILSSVIFVAILAIAFFQWIISMQFRALFMSRKQFNNNVRLMGIPERALLKIYLKEMFFMQPLVLITGIAAAEILYYILSGFLGSGQRLIGAGQIAFAAVLHLAVVSMSIMATYRKMIRRNIVDEIRSVPSGQEMARFDKKKAFSLIAGILLAAAAAFAVMTGDKGGDTQSYGYFGMLIAIGVLFDPVVYLLHQAASRFARNRGRRSLVFSEAVSLGYLKKSSIVCSMILFSATMFLGLQMLYRNVRAAGGDTVDARIHYQGTAWFDDVREAPLKGSEGEAAYGLKYKCKRGESVWYINGVDSTFLGNYETIMMDDSFGPASGDLAGDMTENLTEDPAGALAENLNSSSWDGILMPNMYLHKGDIGKEISLNLEGKEVTFRIAGACYSNNFAHLNFYVSRAYLQKALGYGENSYNIAFLKSEKDVASLEGDAGVAVQTFDELRAESYEKAVSGTALIEMVSIVIVLAAILSLANFIMLSSGEDIRDIARLRGMGLSGLEIAKIYGIEAVISVFWAAIAAIPASILFARIGCTMVFNANYYLRPFILTPSLTVLIILLFMVISYLVRMAAIHSMVVTDNYIEVLRDMSC